MLSVMCDVEMGECGVGVGIFLVVHETTVYLVFFESLCVYRLFVLNIQVVCWLHMLVFEHIQGEWFCVKIR